MQQVMKVARVTVWTWPWELAAGAPAREAPREQRRRRPDVSGRFTVALVCALASGALFLGDALRAHVAAADLLAYAAQHPMAYLVAGCTLLLAGLLAIGEV